MPLTKILRQVGKHQQSASLYFGSGWTLVVSIDAAVEAKLNQSQKESLLPKIQGKISALIKRNVNESQTVESKHTYYLLSYGVDKRL